MGGCRCVYRSCQSSTSTTPGLHYFRFPVGDEKRCDQWIKNARKPELRQLDKSKLKNKLICQLHFASNCFTNIKLNRLIQDAVPTLGFESEDTGAIDLNINDNIDKCLVPDDMLTTFDDIPITDGNATTSKTNHGDIMSLPVGGDNTKFKLRVDWLSETSYIIFDDVEIPTSNIQGGESSDSKKPMKLSIRSDIFNENIPAKSETNFAVNTQNGSITLKESLSVERDSLDIFNYDGSNNTNTEEIYPLELVEVKEEIQVQDDEQHSERKNEEKVYIRKKQDNSKQIKQRDKFSEMSYTISNDAAISTSNIKREWPDSEKSTKNIKLSIRNDIFNINEPTKPETYFGDVVNTVSYATSNENGLITLKESLKAETDPLELNTDRDPLEISNNSDHNHCDSIKIEEIDPLEIPEVKVEMQVEEEQQQTERKKELIKTPEKVYIKMMKYNSKEIKQLKRLIHKQNKANQYVMQHR